MVRLTQRNLYLSLGDIDAVVFCDADGMPVRVKSGTVEMPTVELERIAAAIVEIRRAAAVDGWAVQVCAEHGYWRLESGVNKCPKCEAPAAVPEAKPAVEDRGDNWRCRCDGVQIMRGHVESCPLAVPRL